MAKALFSTNSLNPALKSGVGVKTSIRNRGCPLLFRHPLFYSIYNSFTPLSLISTICMRYSVPMAFLKFFLLIPSML